MNGHAVVYYSSVGQEQVQYALNIHEQQVNPKVAGAVGQLRSHIHVYTHPCTHCTSHHTFRRKQHFLFLIAAQLHIQSSFPNGRSVLFACARRFICTIMPRGKNMHRAARCRGRAISYSRSLFPGGTCDQMDHTALMEAKRGASWVSVSWHSCSFSQ